MRKNRIAVAISQLIRITIQRKIWSNKLNIRNIKFLNSYGIQIYNLNHTSIKSNLVHAKAVNRSLIGTYRPNQVWAVGVNLS